MKESSRDQLYRWKAQGWNGLGISPTKSSRNEQSRYLRSSGHRFFSGQATIFGGCIVFVACVVLAWVCGLGPTLAWTPFDQATSEPIALTNILTKHAITAASPLLQVFQVYPPVLTAASRAGFENTDGSTNAGVALINNNISTCEETLIVHSFAYSYGEPFVGTYVPPLCSFNRVTWNLTVVSAGRQFDRLGIVYFGDTEILRTSTAEPTSTGIEWTYLKDVTNYLSLFKQQQKLIFDLGNLIDSTYTAAYNVTLTAAFFTAPDSIAPADIIIPVSARQSSSNASSVFTVPPNDASNILTLPRNIKRAVFTVAATGQSDEEFWWSNVPQFEVDTFPQSGPLYGYYPFREVQILIDGMLAGVAWPFPVIFTGGVVPGLWRPIVGIDAFDLKEDEIDITPWLPLLCDGNSHNFSIRISGLYDNGNGSASLSEITNSYWLVTGKVFIWLDTHGIITTGSNVSRNASAPTLQVFSTVGSDNNGTNQTLTYQVKAQRYLTISSDIRTSTGSQQASWTQQLNFINEGNYTQGGNVEVNVQNTEGYDVSSSGYSRQINYPLYALSVYSTFGDNYSIAATVNRGKEVVILGQPVFPTGLETFSVAKGVQNAWLTFQGASLSTTQNGSATYIANSTSLASFSFGMTEQDMVFAGVRAEGATNLQQIPVLSAETELFHRYVQAVNSTVVQDEETLVDTSITHEHINMASTHGFGVPGIHDMLGHGPRGKGTNAGASPQS